MDDKRVKLKIQGLTNSQIQSGAYALVLAEDGARRVPVIVGMFEAQAIAIAIEGIATPRPLTHDLFLGFAHAVGYSITEVFIYRFHEGVFYSQIAFANKNGKNFSIDSRTSDAIAIAVRANCAIYTTESIMRKCGVVIDDKMMADEDNQPLPDNLTVDDLKDTRKLKQQLKELSIADIEERINRAVAKEEYEFAKVFRDELLRRQKRSKAKKG
jgi:bifunctional DNase/RNase